MADDSEVLLSTDGPRRRWFLQPKILCPVLVTVGFLSLTAAILIGFFSDNFEAGIPVRIMALNTWGMPAALGAKDKELRMKAIGELVAKQEFDLYLFEELWMRPDHETISQHLPPGYHITSYDSMTQAPCPYDIITPFACCDGAALPGGCSGLALVSRYPLLETSFTMFNVHGPVADGEKLVRKGFGRVRVSPAVNVSLDVFVTHTCASDYVLDREAREAQIVQLVDAVEASEADFVLLGGDFNADPRAANETSYSHLKQKLASSMEDFFKRVRDWLNPGRATYGNPRNSYSSMYAPVLYDYIWHTARPGNLVVTNLFNLPYLTATKTRLSHQEAAEEIMTMPLNSATKAMGVGKSAESYETVSLSDHEAVSANLYLLKRKN